MELHKDRAKREGTPERTELLGLIPSKIAPVKSAPVYRGALFLTAVAMILPPLIYLGLIAGAVYGVYWYALHGVGALAFRPWQVGLVAYFGPLAGGSAMAFFMVKPLFAPRPREEAGLCLEESDQPLLFAFVSRLCQAVGAPPPSEIRVDLRVNASARLRSGFGSLLGDDLTLTLGLPLAAGFSVSECAGVLAHEFGHFSQRAGMSLTFLIWAVNAWFDRVVHERDAWDARLEALSEQQFGMLWAIGSLAMGFVWATRKILWGLMVLGHGISCVMSRQMEYDADLHEIRLVGSRVFESMLSRLSQLSFGGQIAWNDVSQCWEEGRLVDDIPMLAAANTRHLGPSIVSFLETASQNETTGWLDTHPSTADRLARARAENDDGVFRADSDLAEASASILFKDFTALCKRATREHYRAALGDRDIEAAFCGVDEVLAKKVVEAGVEEARQRYFHRLWGYDRPLPDFSPDRHSGTEATELGARLAKLKREIEAGSEAYGEAVAAFRLERKAGLEADSEPVAVAEARIPPQLAPFEALMAERLSLALALARRQNSEAAEEIDRLLPSALLLNQIRPRVTAFQIECIRLRTLCARLAGGASGEDLQIRLRTLIRRVAWEYRDFRTGLGEQPYPFQGEGPSVQLRDHLAPVLLDSEDLGALMESSVRFLDRTETLFRRLMGRLAVLAERAEGGGAG